MGSRSWLEVPLDCAESTVDEYIQQFCVGTGAQYSAVLYARAQALVRKVCLDVPQVVPASFDKGALLDATFSAQRE